MRSFRRRRWLSTAHAGAPRMSRSPQQMIATVGTRTAGATRSNLASRPVREKKECQSNPAATAAAQLPQLAARTGSTRETLKSTVEARTMHISRGRTLTQPQQSQCFVYSQFGLHGEWLALEVAATRRSIGTASPYTVKDCVSREVRARVVTWVPSTGLFIVGHRREIADFPEVFRQDCRHESS